MILTQLYPEKHGFHFSNNDITWSFGPISSKALCGGMSYAVMDYFHYGMSIPVDTTPPAEETNLHSYIYDRQMTAHANTLYKFAGAYTTPFPTLVKESIPRIKELDNLMTTQGPTIICLTGIAKGHHVIAIACLPDGPSPEIWMYDPNFPDEISKLKLTQVSSTFQRWKHSISHEYWYGFFIDTGYTRKVPPALCGEVNWRWCNRCEGLFWNGDGNKGKCPAGGGHIAGGVRNYILAINAGSGQRNWKWCKTCQGLWFGGGMSLGKCPGSPAGHDFHDKNIYFMAQDTGAGEGNWRWCKRCEGMFWAGNPAKGKCPSGGSHDASSSGNYYLMATNVVN